MAVKALLDTCVLYPTVMREVLLAVARTGAFVPYWSDRILEEWRRASAKLGPVGQAQAESEIALLRAAWPKACVTWPPSLEDRLWLPDVNDRHVLAAAIAGSCDLLITLNAKDFPKATLAEEGLIRIDPDSFLMQLWLQDTPAVQAACDQVLDQARRMSETDWQMRPLLKKARLPRLAKAVS